SWRRVLTVRAAPLRSADLSLANACSIGLRSGEYAGRYRMVAPADPVHLVGPQIVQEDDIAFPECGREHLLDIGRECRAMYGTVHDIGCFDAINAQRGYQDHRLPMAVRHLGNQTFPTWAASVSTHHIGRDARLVDEHEAAWVKKMLLRSQLGTRCDNVRTILPAQFFLTVILLREKKPPDRGHSHFQLLLAGKADADLHKCQVGLRGDKIQQPLLMFLERRAAVAVARVLFNASGPPPRIDPADCRGRAEVENPCRLPRALALFDDCDRPYPQILGVPPRHDGPSVAWEEHESDLHAYGNPL